MDVYDDEKQKQSNDSGNPADDELRRLTGIGPKEEKKMDKAAAKGAKDDDKAGGFYNPHGDGGAAAKAQKLEAMAELAVGGNRLAAAKKIFWGTKRRKQATIGGSVAGGAATIFAIVSLFILPLKVVSLVQDVQNHFFASSEQATEDMTEKLMQHYIVQKVMPGMVKNKCTSTRISRSCALVDKSNTVVGQLYNSWRTAKLENKLYKDYGFEIMKKGNTFYLKTNSIDDRIKLGTYDGKTRTIEGKVYAVLDRPNVRKEAKAAVAGETLWKRTLYRFKIGKLLENKYKIYRCVITCKVGDKISESVAVKKRAFQSYLNEKVIKPRSKMLGLAIDCALSGFDCTGGDEVGPDGEHTDEFDRNVQSSLAEVRASGDTSDLKALDDANKEIEKKGITQVLIERLIGAGTGEFVSKAIPIVGWIDLAARLSAASHNLPQAIKTMNYTMYATSAAETWMLYRSSADEIKNGQVDSTVVGSVASSLDANNKADQGGVSAEQTPLYHSIIDNGTGAPSAASLFTPTVAADSTTPPSTEKCNDGSPLKGIACPELTVGNLSTVGNILVVAANINNFFAVPGSQFLVKIWINTAGKILDLIGKFSGAVLTAALKTFPPTNYILKHAEEFTNYMAKQFVDFIFPNVLGNIPSGGRLFEVLSAGADFSAQDVAHYTVGGMVLSPKQSAAVYQRQEDEQKQAFEAKPLMARMFSTSDPMSLVSRLAVAVPSSFGSASSSFFGSITSVLSNPFQPFGQLAAAGFGNSQASAAGGDPFNITQYGIPSSVIDAELAKTGGDPEKYEATYCKDPATVAQAWGKSAVLDTDTGQYNNSKPNMCAAIQNAIAASGCIYNPSLDPDCTTGSGATATDTGSLVVGTYNLLNADGHTPDSIHVAGGCNTSTDRACLHKRAVLQAQIILGQDNNPPIDLIGTQETSPDQYRALRTDLGSAYDGVPSLDNQADVNRMSQQQDGATSIIWNTAKLTKFAEGKTPAISNVANVPNRGHVTAPWVGLQDATGQKYYVTSIHYPNSGFFDPSLGDKGTMLAASRLTMEWVRNMKQRDPSAVEVVMGDFNDEPWQQQSYCVYTQPGLMTNTYDMAKGNDTSKPCPTKQHIGEFGIDEIYVSQNNNFTASGWTHMKKDSVTSHSSDHTPVYVTLSLPGQSSTGSSSAGGLSWPVNVSWWKKDRNDFLDGHGFSSGTFTSPYVKSTSSDISSPPAGTPIYSMLAGKVIAASDCDIIVQSSIQGGTLDIAYGHGNNHKVKLGDQVSSGQQLDSEYQNCRATGPHVHIDMTFNGKHLCPQDVFLAMGSNQTPNFASLVSKIKPPTSCARV